MCGVLPPAGPQSPPTCARCARPARGPSPPVGEAAKARVPTRLPCPGTPAPDPCPASPVTAASSKVSSATFPSGRRFVAWGRFALPPQPRRPHPVRRPPPTQRPGVCLLAKCPHVKVRASRLDARSRPCWLLALQFSKCGRCRQPRENSRRPRGSHAAGSAAPASPGTPPPRRRQVCGGGGAGGAGLTAEPLEPGWRRRRRAQGRGSGSGSGAMRPAPALWETPQRHPPSPGANRECRGAAAGAPDASALGGGGGREKEDTRHPLSAPLPFPPCSSADFAGGRCGERGRASEHGRRAAGAAELRRSRLAARTP